MIEWVLLHTLYITLKACCELAPSAFSYSRSMKVTIKWIIYLVSLQKCDCRTQESGCDTNSWHFHFRPSSHRRVCVWRNTHRQRRRGILRRHFAEHLLRPCSEWVHTQTNSDISVSAGANRSRCGWTCYEKSIFIERFSFCLCQAGNGLYVCIMKSSYQEKTASRIRVTLIQQLLLWSWFYRVKEDTLSK